MCKSVTAAGGLEKGGGAGLPARLKQAWQLAGPATCSASAATQHSAAQHALSALPAGGTSLRRAIAGIALKQVGVGTTPAETSFSGVDCNPYSTMVAGFSANADGCGYDQHFGVEDENEEWCADFSKWVWQQAGVTAGLDTLNAAASSFYSWARTRARPSPPARARPRPVTRSRSSARARSAAPPTPTTWAWSRR